MAGRTTKQKQPQQQQQTVKKTALKRKLVQSSTKPPQQHKKMVIKKATPVLQKKKQRDVLKSLSTKHSAGRKAVRVELDRAAQDCGVSEVLRGVGKPAELTEEQQQQQRRQLRESEAKGYEEHQSAVKDAVADLAQLMSA
ncbi:hypothetical protein LPJ66_000158 [Kickxella alabastrina]|uniref:Uncharacterized protein n=1 Tax=Kickxella alabastrina TaxID=61397 RepID=A0ACC1IX44_9FUNG|nr:hypothetical protein LPJ66_000158 [Kickxella alabastrina]